MPTEAENKQILEELESIKRLLVAALAKNGVSQEQLAKILQTSQPTISRMLPSGFSVPKKTTNNMGKAKRKRR